MKIDSSIKEFLEKYNDEAMQSIEEISSEFGLVSQRNKIKLFNLNEDINKFINYMEGYSNYKIKNINNENASTNESISDQVNIFMDKELFKESEVLYSELPKFVSSYINGIKDIGGKVDEWKEKMLEAEVDYESIGIINDFVDTFTERLNEKFDNSMNKILWASGYNSKKKLSENKVKELKPIFL
jgi:tRNA U34 5-carboxymethylaminomethyl modifying enzyme MnmG/GidA